MKALLAANQVEAASQGVRLLGRLKFDPCSVDVVSIVEPFYPYAPTLGPGIAMPVGVDLSEIQRSAEKHCTSVAEQVCAELGEYSLTATSHLETGRVGETLNRCAEVFDTDLVVVGGGEKGAVEAFVFGSVTRFLSSHSVRSFVVGRGVIASRGPVRVLFATDHSEYANNTVEEFIRLQPTGLERITILSAYGIDLEVPLGTQLAMPESYALEEQRIVDELHEKNKAVAARFSHLGCETICMEVRGAPNQVISDVMEQGESELLVMGARGHGFVDRLVLGSTSHHMVATQPFSVLVLRPT